jgi:PAS domain S-box-containing protein
MSARESSLEIYRVLYEDVPSMYFTVDAEGTVLSVNRFGAEQLGYPAAELIGQAVTGVFHPDDRTAVIEQLALCCRNPGDAFEWELRKLRRDGSLMWVHEHARAVRDADDRLVILIVCEDITEQRRTREALRHSRERYRTLYTKTPALLHSIDGEHRVVDVSEHWLEVLGYERDEVIGRKFTDFLTDESRRFAGSFSLPEVIERGEARNLEYRIVTKGGDVRDVRLSAIAERDVDDRFVRSLAVLEDVTERKRAEAALREANAEMECRVAERTAELRRSQDALRDLAGKLLAAQEEERRRLAREIHDDLTQRLAGLAMLTGRLEQELPEGIGAEAARQLGEINRELTSLSGDVHTLSRQLHPSTLENLGLEDALRSECESFSHRSGIEVAFTSRNVPPGISPELGIAFYRIAQEGLRNVASHAGVEEARVTLEGDADRLRLSIEDRGAGFDPACPSRTRGIGLASIEERARLVGAEISIDAAPGRGTTLVVRAPIAGTPAE